MNFSKIKENALKYLGYHHQILDEKMNVLIDECIEEIEKIYKKVFPDFIVVSTFTLNVLF